LESGQLAEIPLSNLLIGHLREWGHVDENNAVENTNWSGAFKVAPKIHGEDVNRQYFRSYFAEVQNGKIRALPLLPDNLEWKNGAATISGSPEVVFWRPPDESVKTSE
jgi:hypothetical protein